MFKITKVVDTVSDVMCACMTVGAGVLIAALGIKNYISND